jgi:hypothetical protein
MKIQSTTFEPLDNPVGWYATPEAKHDCYPLIDLALKLQASALAKGHYCICGMKGHEGYHLYLAPATGVKSVLAPFAIGSHGGDDVESVFAQIGEADAENPLIPYFADGAGLKAKFSKPVTAQLLELLERTIVDGEIMMSDDDGSIREFVKANNEIQLWWD